MQTNYYLEDENGVRMRFFTFQLDKAVALCMLSKKEVLWRFK